MARLLDIRNELNLCLSRVHGLHMVSQAVLQEDRDDGNALAVLVEDIRVSLCVVKDGLAELKEARS